MDLPRLELREEKGDPVQTKKRKLPVETRDVTAKSSGGKDA